MCEIVYNILITNFTVHRCIIRSNAPSNLQMQPLGCIFVYALNCITFGTAIELTVLTGLSKSAVSRLIEHLERKELLQKKYNSNDKRSYTLLCTAKGTMELEKTYQYYLEPIYRLRKILGDEKFEALIKYIKEANDLMMKNGR